jgi:hypothetical protein
VSLRVVQFIANSLLKLFIWNKWSWMRDHIHVHRIVWSFRNYNNKYLHPEWSSWTSTERITLFTWLKYNCKLPTSLGACGCTHHIHFKFIKLLSYGSFRYSGYMDIWHQIFSIYMSVMSCTYWYHQLSIYLWERESWRYKYPSFIIYLRLSKGDFYS